MHVSKNIKFWNLVCEDGAAVVLLPYSFASPLQKGKTVHGIAVSYSILN
jgi:hypothetical protein